MLCRGPGAEPWRLPRQIRLDDRGSAGKFVAGEEDVGPALLQDMTEDGVERLHYAGAGRGHLGGLLRDRGFLAVGQCVGRGVERVTDVDDYLAREGVSIL